eukprot:scpid23734/ scgid25479/ SEC23-interacting protein; p125
MAEPGLPPGDRAVDAQKWTGTSSTPAPAPASTIGATIGDPSSFGGLSALRGTADLNLSGLSFSPAASSTSGSSLGTIGLAGSTDVGVTSSLTANTDALTGTATGATGLPSVAAGSVVSSSSITSTGAGQVPVNFSIPAMPGPSPALPGVSSLAGPTSAFATSGISTQQPATMSMARSASPDLARAAPVHSTTGSYFSTAHAPAALATATTQPLQGGVGQGSGAHRHVPLIPVSTGTQGFQPLTGLGTSPMPPMTTSSMVGVPAPPVSSSFGAHQVPHALVAPLPVGAESAVAAAGVEEASDQMPLLAALDQPAKKPAPLQHWFFCKTGEPWTPFSLSDSSRLEAAYQSTDSNAGSTTNDLIPTDGGRYDVDLSSRLRHSVFWKEEASEVRRCMWFYKDDASGLFSPYSETLSERLESEYQQGIKYNVWQRKIDLPGGQRVVMHNAELVVDYAAPPAQPSVQQLAGVVEQRPRVVQRGLDETDELEDGESLDVGHLVFVVNGIAAGDRRDIVAHVDDFRQSTQCMLHEHFPLRAGKRVEFLPVQWSSSLRGDDIAVVKELESTSLPNCGRLRSYSNSAFMDIMFYSSPAYCQSILSSVANEMERVLELFQGRNAGFTGDVSVVGHSLGACILFDLLSHQGSADPKLRMMSPASSARPSMHSSRTSLHAGGASIGEEDEDQRDGAERGEVQKPPALTIDEVLSKFGLQGFAEKFAAEMIDIESFKQLAGDDLKEIGIPMGPRKKLMTFLREHIQAEEAYQRHLLDVQSRKTIAEAARREAERVRTEQAAADAQREAEQQAAGLRPFTYRSSGPGVGNVFVDYPQLSFLLRSFFAVGSPIAMFCSLRGIKLGPSFHLPTCPTFFNIFHPYDPMAYRVEPLVDAALQFPPVQVPHHKGRKRMHLELRENLGRVGTQLKKNFMESLRQTWQAVQEFAASHRAGAEIQQSAAEDMAELERERRQVEEELSKQELPSPTVDDQFQLLNVPPIGILNNGERMDYVLQERPFESFNEYMFSIQSHSSYWSNEDTALLILRQLFTGQSVPSTPSDTNIFR